MAVEWPDLWQPAGDRREALEAELALEVGPKHVLHGQTVIAIAFRDDEDDVLFRLDDGRVALVHLTYIGGQESDPRWPSCQIFESLAAFVAQARRRGGDAWI